MLLEEVSSSMTGVRLLDSILRPRKSVLSKLHSVSSPFFWSAFHLPEHIPYHRASRTKFFGCHWRDAGLSYRQLGMIELSPLPLHTVTQVAVRLLIPLRLHSSTSKRNLNLQHKLCICKLVCRWNSSRYCRSTGTT